MALTCRKAHRHGLGSDRWEMTLTFVDGNTSLTWIAHSFLLKPWFPKEIKFHNCRVCRPSHPPLSHSLSSSDWIAQQEWRLEEQGSQGHVLLENPQPGKRKIRFVSPLRAHSLIPLQDLAGMSASLVWPWSLQSKHYFLILWHGILWAIGDWWGSSKGVPLLQQEQKQGSSAAYPKQCGFFLMELLFSLAATEYCCNCSLACCRHVSAT